ncbi:hypothetical protein ACR6C2_25865 [Streptomyces sp. INA 01156]
MDRVLPYSSGGEALLSSRQHSPVASEGAVSAKEIVVGGGGLLGSHILSVLGNRLRRVRVPWDDHAQACEHLYALGRELAEQQPAGTCTGVPVWPCSTPPPSRSSENAPRSASC